MHRQREREKDGGWMGGKVDAGIGGQSGAQTGAGLELSGGLQGLAGRSPEKYLHGAR